uniref:Uncharacterized protein n=1 Tax=Anguilla anguilla TaxID=7936 RepID=A0A0E9T6E3_ANGAN
MYSFAEKSHNHQLPVPVGYVAMNLICDIRIICKM